MKIKYNNRALLHAYQKHGVTKDQIENSLASGIDKKIRDKVNDSIIIFTKSLCIVVDYSLNLRTAFMPNKRYYKICGIAIIISLVGAARIDKALLLTMDIIDTIGYTFNISTIKYIDKLNEIYYNLGYK